MALVSCPECQKEVSTHALACPQCALPFPGKQARGVGQAGTKLHACHDCGFPVSKQAQTCPHCGVTLEGEQREREQRSLTIKPNFVEETWLCTHCGTPYTRKVRQENGLVTDHQVVVPPSKAGGSVGRLLEPASHQETVVPPSNGGRSMEKLLEPVPHQEAVVPRSNTGQSVERPLGPIPNQVKRGNVSASSRRRSHLWQDSSFGEEIESFLPRRYPRSRKKSILLGLLVFILIAAAVVSGALWQLQGINPLEVLVYWRM
jgi:ribosomal protein L37E